MKACPLTRIQNFQHTYLLEFGLHPQKPVTAIKIAIFTINHGENIFMSCIRN